MVPSEENKNEEEEEEKPFNETAYLLGKIPLIQGGEVDPDIIKGNTTTVFNYYLFNKTAYLLGKIPLIQGGEVDPEIIKGNTTTVFNLLSI